jgi:hypothetical protein
MDEKDLWLIRVCLRDWLAVMHEPWNKLHPGHDGMGECAGEVEDLLEKLGGVPSDAPELS